MTVARLIGETRRSAAASPLGHREEDMSSATSRWSRGSGRPAPQGAPVVAPDEARRTWPAVDGHRMARMGPARRPGARGRLIDYERAGAGARRGGPRRRAQRGRDKPPARRTWTCHGTWKPGPRHCRVLDRHLVFHPRTRPERAVHTQQAACTRSHDQYQQPDHRPSPSGRPRARCSEQEQPSNVERCLLPFTVDEYPEIASGNQ